MSLMVLLSKPAPASVVPQRRPVGRPVGAAMTLIEGSALRDEARQAWGAVRVLSNRVHLAVVADRPDLALHSAGRITSIADRALRQLDGGNDAA